MSEFLPPTCAAFSIRRAEPSDLESLVQLRIDFLQEVNEKAAPIGLRQSLTQYFQQNLPSGEFLSWLAIANEPINGTNQQIVGTSGLVFINRPPSYSNLSGCDAYIMNMYRLPSWRGRGVGTVLFSQVMQYIRTSGSGKVLLHATEQGRVLYEKFGFRVADGEVEMSLKIVAPSPE